MRHTEEFVRRAVRSDEKSTRPTRPRHARLPPTSRPVARRACGPGKSSRGIGGGQTARVEREPTNSAFCVRPFCSEFGWFSGARSRAIRTHGIVLFLIALLGRYDGIHISYIYSHRIEPAGRNRLIIVPDKWSPGGANIGGSELSLPKSIKSETDPESCETTVYVKPTIGPWMCSGCILCYD